MTKFISYIYSFFIFKKLTGLWKIRGAYFSRNMFRVKIVKRKNSLVVVNGCINFRSHLGSEEPIRIILEEGAQLFIEGDIEISAGCVILVRQNATLRIGGKKYNKAAGMASNCKILVKDKVDIGIDVVMGWDVLITDSDWHNIEDSEISKPVYIEDKVWLSHHVSVHKGVTLKHGCLVAAHSLVLSDLPPKILAGGVPARHIRQNIQWTN